MKLFFSIIWIYLLSTNMVLFDFNTIRDMQNWNVVDDVVMGGRSQGTFSISEEGHAVFQGEVSLDNNGGFSSVRNRFEKKEIDGYQKVMIRLKGDGKRYQFRVKSNAYDRHSYVSYFQTTGSWQTVEIPLAEMYPTFRGRKLAMPDFPGKEIAEIAFLIGNNKAEAFKLEIDRISLEK